eukprot:c20538_g1_i1.p1 GENE.c20538_g1_i1~~c20538_g1_i1.p1  ORF type:complete len:175 (-),score=25.63 c20538_g1_i1:146-670(-)
MAKINSRVVRRTNFLLSEFGLEYGPDFEYKECSVAPSEAVAVKLARAESVPPAVLEKMVKSGALYQPGQGPTKAERAKGKFMLILVAQDDLGNTLTGSIRGGDAGYDETAKIAAEAAVVLSRGVSPVQCGVVTPAIGLGLSLVKALSRAGVSFNVHPGGPKEALALWTSKDAKL